MLPQCARSQTHNAFTLSPDTHAGVNLYGREALVHHELLDDPNVDALFDEGCTRARVGLLVHSSITRLDPSVRFGG